MIIHTRRIEEKVFIKIYKPTAAGLTETLEDVVIASNSTYSNMRYVNVSTVSGNNFPDGATITMYSRLGAV